MTILMSQTLKPILFSVLIATGCLTYAAKASPVEHPNVIFIICDDLNDYVEGFGGHPQTKTPNMAIIANRPFLISLTFKISKSCGVAATL